MGEICTAARKGSWRRFRNGEVGEPGKGIENGARKVEVGNGNNGERGDIEVL